MDTGTPTRPRTTIRARGRRTARTAAAALTIGALASCATDRSPTQTTSPPASSAITVPTPGPSATAGTGATASGTTTGFDVLANMPATAKEHTTAGAQAFARYYIEAYGRLLMEPAKGRLPKLYLPQCTECQGQEANIADNLDHAVRWRDLYYRIETVLEPNVDGRSVDAADVREVQLASLLTTVPVVVEEGSAPPTTRPKSHDVLVRFNLTWLDGRWQVADFQSQFATPAAS